MVIGNLFIAAAIGAKRFTEWQVYINGYSINVILLAETGFKNLLPFGKFNIILPEWNSRVTCIPGDRFIILPDQQRIDYFTFHISKIEVVERPYYDLGYENSGPWSGERLTCGEFLLGMCFGTPLINIAGA